MRALFLGLALWLVASGHAHADGAAAPHDPLGSPPELMVEAPNPHAPSARPFLFAHLYRSPWRALAYEAVLPGAGFWYAGFRAQAIVSSALSVLGAGLWVAGAVRDEDALKYTGVGTFAAARTYGVVGAPVSALLLNAALRRQVGFSIYF